MHPLWGYSTECQCSECNGNVISYHMITNWRTFIMRPCTVNNSYLGNNRHMMHMNILTKMIIQTHQQRICRFRERSEYKCACVHINFSNILFLLILPNTPPPAPLLPIARHTRANNPHYWHMQNVKTSHLLRICSRTPVVAWKFVKCINSLDPFIVSC